MTPYTGDEPDLVLRYADHADGILDVHLPATDGGDLVLLVHGGYWKAAYDRTHSRPMARALADAGFVVATPEYRRVGPGGSGGWPATGEDVRRAADALPDLLAGAGIAARGPARAVGHSAGGQLVLWLAGIGVPLERVVALAPVSDLREAIRRGLGADATRALLGGADPDPADPMVLLDRRPAYPIVVVHGTADADVPYDLSERLVARHPWIELHTLPGVGHFEIIDPADPAFGTVLTSLA